MLFLAKSYNVGESTPSLRRLFQRFFVLIVKSFFLGFLRISPGVTCTNYPLYFLCDSLWKRVSIFYAVTLLILEYRDEVSPKTSFLRADQSQFPQPFLTGFPVPGSSLWPFSEPSPACPQHSCIVGPKTACNISGVEESGIVAPLSLLVMPL